MKINRQVWITGRAVLALLAVLFSKPRHQLLNKFCTPGSTRKSGKMTFPYISGPICWQQPLFWSTNSNSFPGLQAGGIGILNIGLFRWPGGPVRQVYKNLIRFIARGSCRASLMSRPINVTTATLCLEIRIIECPRLQIAHSALEKSATGCLVHL